MSKVKHYLSKIKSMDKNTILVSVAVIGVIIAGGLIYANSNPGFALPNLFGMSDQQIAQNAVKYINDNHLSQATATLNGKATEESGLIKFPIKLGSSPLTVYASKDGKFFFPEVFSMTAVKKTTAATTGSTTPAPNPTAKKTDSPALDAYVVSSCPFGLQMQRAITAAVKAVPDLAKYVTVRYIGNVASSGKTIDSMHGPEEGAENLRQICIRDEQPAKYYPYIACYMKKTTATAAGGMPLGDSPSCQAAVGVDTAKLNACVSDPSRGVADAKKDFDLATKYNNTQSCKDDPQNGCAVAGSPSLVLNGVEASSGDRSASGILSAVCSGFNNQPSFCTKKIDSTQASYSFSLTYAQAPSTGGTASNTNCNTPQ